MKYHQHFLFYGTFVIFYLSACGNIDFDDPSTLTNDEANAKITDLGYTLATSSIQNAFFTSTNYASCHLSILADQVTNLTNEVMWIDFTKEPRQRITNNSNYAGYRSISDLYTGLYQANLDATKALELIENQGLVVKDAEGNDRTKDCQIAAYYAKGVAQGYLGVIYDRGIIIDDVNTKEKGFPNSYSELINNGIQHIEKSLELAAGSNDINFDFLSGNILSKDQFVQLANSIAARILSSLPRDEDEALSLGDTHWQKVLNFATKGLSSDLLITTVTGGYYSEQLSTLLLRASDGTSYRNWVDIKIPFLADKTGNTPNKYPLSGVLDAITTNDDRFYQYFAYSRSFGTLRENRGRQYFSNYIKKRWYNTTNTLNIPGALNPYFLTEEVRLIQSEAKYWLKDYAGAAELLNAPAASRIKNGHLSPIDDSPSDIKNALHYEYAIEIDGAGGAFLPFTFMRRNNLLVGGTPTEYPIPQDQLELAGIQVYSFGGFSNIGEKGVNGETSVAADEGWKKSDN